jgi:hypothetical protein
MRLKNTYLSSLGITVSLVFVLSALCVSARQIRTGTQPNRTVDYDRLAKIDGLINAHVSSNWVEGVVTIVVKDNQLVQYKGYGYADAVFMQMLLNDGVYDGHRILAPRTVELMVQNQIGGLSLGNNKFGLGFEVVTEAGAAEGPRNAGTFAWGGYYGTSYFADPKAHLVCLVMTQQTPNSHADLMKKIEAMIYANLKP